MPERNGVIEAEREDIRLIGRIEELLALQQILAQDTTRTGEADTVRQHFRVGVGQCSRQAVREALVKFELERVVSGIGVRRRGSAYALILRKGTKSLGHRRAAAIERGEPRERLLDSGGLRSRGSD